MTELKNIVERQREFFLEGGSKTKAFRKENLSKLKNLISNHEEDIVEVLREDLGKSAFESYVSEIAFVKEEIDFALDNLDDWMKPVKAKTPIAAQPAKSYTLYEPLGLTLIISPWNYPLNLTLDPLVGAMAAGNTAIIKTSSKTPHTSKLIREMVNTNFPDEYIYVVDNDLVSHDELLSYQYDHIFYTGGREVGKRIMEVASQNLSKVTLELGGKSPCIVDRTANLSNAARSIAWGKTFNAGQTCVAPDYILVDVAIKDEFIKRLRGALLEFFGEDPLRNPDYPKIINQDHLDRLVELTKDQDIIWGGSFDRENLKLAPTIIDGVDFDNKVMEEEIFGPIIPILTYDNINPILYKIKRHPKPLAFYLFSEDKRLVEKVMYNMEFGNGCVNEVLMEISSPYLEFGGVGGSGMGGYHGYNSFVNFSNKKSIMEASSFPRPKVKYPPYTKGKLELIKKIF